MSKPKKPKVNLETLTQKQKAVLMKKAGLLTMDLRGNLDKTKRRKVNATWKQYKEIALDPQQFKRLKVNRAQQINARHSSLPVSNGNVFIPRNKGFVSAKVVDNRIIIKKVIGKKNGPQEKRKETIILSRRKNIIAELERMSATGYLKPHEYLMVRIGKNSPFKVAFDPKEMMNYVTNWRTDAMKKYDLGDYKGDLTYQELKDQQEGLISQMYLVEYKLNLPKPRK